MPTLTATIDDGADDAQEAAGTVTVTGAVVNCNNSNQYIGFRFQGTELPQGATINSAVLSVYLTSGSYDTPQVTQYGQLIANAPAFTTNASDISGRTLTTAGVPWTATPGGTGWRQPPDITAVVQEIVDQEAWAEGNYFAVILKGNNASSLLRLNAYESGTATRAYIVIDYSTAAEADIPSARLVLAGCVVVQPGQRIVQL